MNPSPASPSSAIYLGQVVHKRLAPRTHAFRYRVFALALDLDELPRLGASLRLFAYNDRGLTSFHEADHGCRDGHPVARHIRSILAGNGLGHAGARIVLLCYPRLLGYVFNPLSVYFCYDSSAHLSAIVYEVSNTFAERISYVIPVAETERRAMHQTCAKQMYVSPFTHADAEYGFHVLPPADDVVVGVTLREGHTPILKTHFRGDRVALTDRAIATVVARLPMMTLKVIAGIHVEAARLWLKGVPVVPRHVSPSYSVKLVDGPERVNLHA